ncbi:MAG TPA: hypothetical protein VEZ90_01265, partial [Blastocatellia bacterium]|nr:hypothetical protein [Blastocatellia bacterium]
MRIVIFGGSSQSTPVLFQCLTGISHSELTVTLIGRSRANLAAVERAAKLLLGHSRLSITCAGIQEPAVQMSLVDAHIVIIQVRVGGYRGRAYDETFPLKFGVCGDEGLGPGGLSAAWRAWPTVRKILSQVQEIAPEALVLMLTSPVGILVRAARRL